MTYTVELDLALTVEVLEAVRGAGAGPWAPPEPDWVGLCVRLGALDVTEALPVDVLETLHDDALERLRRAADEP